MIGLALAATALLSFVAAVAVVRLAIKGKIGLGIWDIPIAGCLVLLSIALAATAGAVWRTPL